MNWFKKAIAGVMSLGMMFTLVPVNAEEEPARDLEAEKAAFLATLNADGYAEVGKYKVEKLTDNVYHMDEGTKALPGGAEDENGAMNNPSSIYFAVEDNDVLIVDLGNPATGDVELDAKVIVEAMTAGKNVTIALTHSHGDHTGLGRSTAVFENVNVTKLYVSNPDMAGSLRAAKQFEGVAVGLDDGESFEVAGKKYTMYIVPCHTAGSVMIENLTDNILYTGDTFGSGFVWALWGMNNGNPLAALDAGVARARTILNGMNSPRILAGHRWQQFWTENAQRPNEMSIQYFNDMGQVLTGLTNGSTLIEDYSAREGAVELSQPGCRAKVDTMPEYIDAYLIGLSTIDEAYIYNASNKLSIDSVNATAAPKFVIFPDGAVSDEEAQALIDDSGIVEYIDRSASSAYVVRPINGEKFTAEDVARFEAVVGDQIGLSNNFKLIGIGNGADFVANYLTDYFNFVSGLALINPTSAAEIKVSVPVFISGNAEAAAPYIKANKAQESGSEGTITRYVNPNSKYEVVVTDTAKLDGAAGIKEAWSEVLKYFGRIGNYTTEQKTVATWYSRPFLTGDKEYDTARRYQYFQSIDSIDDADMERTVVTEDLDGDGQLSLWYEYVPAKVKDASKGTVPVVFLMHGNTNDPRTQYDTAEWGHLAVEEGVILVAPEWQGHVYQGYSYQAMSGRREAGSDETYVISVLEKVLKKYPQADPSRVYMTGLSAGSMQTTTYGSTNPKYFAAGGGHSGPFSGNINSAQKYAKDYDFPIIYFTGDCDEYLMSSFDTATMTGAISCLNTFRILNDMEPLTQDDLKEELSDLYGVEWDEVYTIAPGAANIPEIAGGIMANDRGIEISFNRIRGWGHWNYSPDTYYMWNFMKKYARDLRTGASIRLDQEAEKGVVVAPNTDFPESDAPYQVTFTLDSVEAYDKVDLIGGFQFYTDEQAAALQDGSEPSPVSYDAYQYKEGMWPAGYDVSGIGNRAYPMENIGSKWTVTIPVPAGVWFYAFNVTPKGSGQTIKLLDPASDTPYNEANGHDNGWSLITIGNSDEHLPGQEWVFPEAEKKGATEFVTYTAIDGTEQPLGVYLPPEYDASKKYPVVYVSHGGGGNEVEWHFLGATDTIMDNLIEAGLVEPTIVVTMDNTYFRWARDTVCNNVMDYIIPYIDANYSIDNVPERRAFCGLSMGGGTSNYMFLDHAGDFKYIGIWSGCYPNEDYSNVANKDYPSLMLGAGCIDMARPGFPILMEKLDEIGVYYEYTEAHGAHDWSVWRELFTTFAKDYLWKSADEKPAEGVVIAPNTDFPDVDVENQATFTFRAPEGTQSVALYGNFQYYDPADIARFQAGRDVEVHLPFDYKPGMYNTGYVVSGAGGYAQIPMEKVDMNLWSITMPLPSTEYCYQFAATDAEGKTVNYKDPTNMPFKNIDSDSGWSLIWVGDRDSAIAGQEYIYPAEQQGTVDYITFTTLEGAEQPLGVYLPYGYDESKTYKTLYLSHGGGGNEVEWFNIGSANNIFDNLIAEGLLEPTVIVTMDFSYLGFTSDAGMKNLTDAIIPLIEEKYAVSKEAKDRAISGLSAGGQAATKAMAVAIDKFGYYGVWSPSAANVFSLGADGKPQATARQLRDLNKGIIYYVSVGAFDNATRRTTEANLVGTIRENGGFAAFDFANGAHDWGVWRQQLTNFAKDYLWKEAPKGGVTVEANTNPEWKAPYAVTFTYVNMDPKEVAAVELQGGFQFYKDEEVKGYQGSGDNSSIPCYDAYHYEDGMFSSSFSTQLGGQIPYQMEEIFKGVYQITLPLPGFEYYYAYYVTYADGTTSGKKFDPNNMPHVAPSGSNSGWSLLYVGDASNTTPGQEFIYPVAEGAGNVEFRAYTAFDGSEQWIGIYTPADYDQNKTYPVIYVSHGGGGNEEEWFYIGSAGNIMDNLLARGLTKEAIIVTMDNSVFGFNNANCGDNIVNYIIPFMEKYYNVGTTKFDRAFCGLSSGAMQTNEMARMYPDVFGYIGAFSGGSRALDPAEYNVEELNNGVYYLTAGCIDMAWNNTMGISSVDYMKMLDEAGIKYSFDLLRGGHDWGVWRDSLTRFIRDYCWSLDKAEKFTGFKYEDGKYYWYEEDVKQGVYGDPKNITDTIYDVERGREIYDPKSDAWYWLDACYGGAAAVDKEVWMPYIMQEDLETGANPEGKWVRYDKYGQMVKGWYANDNGVYYYDLITGAMLKGTHVINGKTYTFDELTGIMK